MAEDPESRDYYCEVIMDEAGKMNKMVKQLLTLTALEFGNDMPVMEQFDIVNLIQGVLTSAGLLLQQKGAAAVFEADGPVYVWADEFKIEEVVTNYLNIRNRSRSLRLFLLLPYILLFSPCPHRVCSVSIGKGPVRSM